MTRELSPSERFYWICDQVTPLLGVGHVRLRGPLRPEEPEQGLRALQARHPLLRVAIEPPVPPRAATSWPA